MVGSGTAAFGCAGDESDHPFMEDVAAAIDQLTTFNDVVASVRFHQQLPSPND